MKLPLEIRNKPADWPEPSDAMRAGIRVATHALAERVDASLSFILTHNRLIDAMQAGESDLAYSLTRLLCLVAVSDESLRMRRAASR